jgi:N-acetyl-1-D-myo-inositol-2-amino-2-deoxy-alpha-D-glucopyranoside deacetylase
MTGGLLAVHAHPDDETLATGGLLATWAMSGRAATVVTCTRGELGEVIGPDLAHLEGAGPALAAHREQELAAALAALGADGLFLDTVGAVGGTSDEPVRGTSDDSVRYTDSGMAWVGVGQAGHTADPPPDSFVAVPVEEAAARLAAVIRRLRPSVVVTYEPGGGYGHPDHVRAHDVTMRAVDLAGRAEPASDPPHDVDVVLWAAVGSAALRSAYQGLGEFSAGMAPPERARLELPDPAGPLPSVAVPDDLLDLYVDVEPVLGRVVAALRAHQTQVQAVRVDDDDEVASGRIRVVGCYALSNNVLVPLLSHEAYRCAPGYSPAVVLWPTGVTPVT